MGENIFNLPLRSKDDYIVNMLSSYKIDTIEKVTQFGTKELYDYIRKLDENMSEESLKDGIRYLIFQIHLLGYLFVGEDSSILGKNVALAPKSLKILSLSDKTFLPRILENALDIDLVKFSNTLKLTLTLLFL